MLLRLLGLWSLICLGGWLMAGFVAWRSAAERLVAGLALGFILFTLAVNLLARSLPVDWAAWLGGSLLVIIGLPHQLRQPGRRPGARARNFSWIAILALAATFVFMLLINRGLSLFDDYHNLPLVSLLASQGTPPDFYLHPGLPLVYHYGLHVAAAALMGAADLFPWSAFDLAKAWTQALTLILGWLWLRRHMRARWASTMAVVLLLASGTRWLLLLLPEPALNELSVGVALQGSARSGGRELATGIGDAWRIEGDGPIPFPFAYLSALYPLSLQIGGNGAAPLMISLLLLLAWSRRPSASWALLYGLMLGGLALFAEIFFAVFWSGLLVAVLLEHCARHRQHLRAQAVVLALSGLVALTQGGVLTELLATGLDGRIAPHELGYSFAGFRRIAAPAFPSAHLGDLQLTNPGQALLALLEMGPVAWLAIPIVGLAIRRWRRSPFHAGLTAATLLAFATSFFVRYGVERDTSRIVSAALYVWLLLGLPWFVWRWPRSSGLASAGLATTAAVSCLGGAVLLAVQIAAIPQPQLAFFVSGADARISRDHWNNLPGDGQVLDSQPHRSVTLFGRAVTSHSSLFQRLPDYDALLQDPDPRTAKNAGFGFVYTDEAWGRSLGDDDWERYDTGCPVLLAEERMSRGRYRRLYSLAEC